jgi:hypothetical protein
VIAPALAKSMPGVDYRSFVAMDAIGLLVPVDLRARRHRHDRGP